MEKRRELVNAKEDPCTPEHNKKDMEKYRTARSILYRGLRHNPASVLILQVSSWWALVRWSGVEAGTNGWSQLQAAA